MSLDHDTTGTSLGYDAICAFLYREASQRFDSVEACGAQPLSLFAEAEKRFSDLPVRGVDQSHEKMLWPNN